MPKYREDWGSVAQLLEDEARRLRQNKPDSETLEGVIEDLIEDLTEIKDDLVRL